MKRLLAGLLAVVAIGAHADDVSGHTMEWKCKETGRNSMQCAVQNKLPRDAELCVDVVKVCKDGDHVATLCSGPLRSGESTAVVVRDFQPKVKFFAGCMGVEFRNKAIR
jgi:hypothetical protein